VNSQLNANLTIDAGAGDDVVNTFGSGDWIIKLGAGKDTYYSDNTGHLRGDSTAETVDSTGRATWVFNTADQGNVSGVEPERQLNNLLSDTNDNYISNATDLGTPASALGGLYGLELRVVFKDLTSDAAATQGTYASGAVKVKVPTAADAGYKVTDRDINLAIQKAIAEDPVLSKLLVATIGTGDTLVVRALSDGAHVAATDLAVEFRIPSNVVTDLGAWRGALGITDAATWDTLAEANTAVENALQALTNSSATLGTTWQAVDNTATNDSYLAALANDGEGRVITGKHATHVTGNDIDSGADNDVIVLSTGHSSHDTIVYSGFNNGSDTIVNFQIDTTVAATNPAAVFTVDLAGATATSLSDDTPYMLTVGDNVLSSTVSAGSGNEADTVIAGKFASQNVIVGTGDSAVQWDVTVNGTVLTFTQHTATSTPPVIPEVSGLDHDNVTTLTPPTSYKTTTTEIGGDQGDLGIDSLDFSSYEGVVAVYLDNTFKLDSTGTEVGANKDLVATTTNAGASGSMSLGSAAAVDGLAEGDKYIILKLMQQGKSQYEITLWKNNAADDDVKVDFFNHNATGIDTYEGLIGTVDFGKVLATNTATTDWFETGFLNGDAYVLF
jgi:hypothetical protein